MQYNIDLITEDTLNEFVDHETVEGQDLEFKAYKMPGGKIEDKQKDGIIKAIVGLANAEGGLIVVGIREKDGLAKEIVGIGCTIKEFDKLQLSIKSYLESKARPRVYGFKMKPIELKNRNIVLAIVVAKSVYRPHAVNDGNKDNFYIRHGNSTINMSVDDLRKQFNFNLSYRQEIRQFRDERIFLMSNGESVGNLSNGWKLLVHAIPLWSLEIGNTIDIKLLGQKEYDKYANIYVSGYYHFNSDGYCSTHFNSDGYCSTHLNYKNKLIDSYFQIFRNGIIEAVDIGLTSRYKGEIDYRETEEYLCKSLKNFSYLLNKLQVPKPWYIYISLIDVKGYKDSNPDNEVAICKDRVHLTESIWEDELTSLDQIIRPTFNSLANCFGLSESPNFDENGNYKN